MADVKKDLEKFLLETAKEAEALTERYGSVVFTSDSDEEAAKYMETIFELQKTIALTK